MMTSIHRKEISESQIKIWDQAFNKNLDFLTDSLAQSIFNEVSSQYENIASNPLAPKLNRENRLLYEIYFNPNKQEHMERLKNLVGKEKSEPFTTWLKNSFNEDYLVKKMDTVARETYEKLSALIDQHEFQEKVFFSGLDKDKDQKHLHHIILEMCSEEDEIDEVDEMEKLFTHLMKSEIAERDPFKV